jgi:hypothetical protein
MPTLSANIPKPTPNRPYSFAEFMKKSINPEIKVRP